MTEESKYLHGDIIRLSPLIAECRIGKEVVVVKMKGVPVRWKKNEFGRTYFLLHLIKHKSLGNFILNMLLSSQKNRKLT